MPFTHRIYHQQPDGSTLSVPYEVVAECDESDLGWEWHVGWLMRSPEGKLYYAEGSGCSCYYMEPTPADLTPVSSWHEAVTLAKQSSVAVTGYGFTDSDIARFAELCMQFFDNERKSA